jgi:hypothetical protein
MRTMHSGFGFLFGIAGGIAASSLALAGGASEQPVISVVLLVVVIDAVAVLSTMSATFATAAICWALHVWLVVGHPAGHDALVFALNALGAAVFVSLARDAVSLDVDV